MFEDEMEDVSQATLPPLTEEEYASWHCAHGFRVISHAGRWWKQTSPGFFQSLHWMARLTAEQATRPTPFCWGFQTTLSQQAAAIANASMPLHVLPNLSTYDLDSLNSKRRYNLRKCLRRVHLVRLTGLSLLREQGYEVYVSSTLRTGYGAVKTKEHYILDLERLLIPGKSLILVGFIGDKLGGYVTGHAIDDAAYLDNVVIATEALPTSIGSGLVFEFTQACRSSSQVRELIYGLHTPEREPLLTFKEGMGFVSKHVPALVHILPPIAKFLSWKYPYKYYRLTGQLSAEAVA
jgi:hypothetical protein